MAIYHNIFYGIIALLWTTPQEGHLPQAYVIDTEAPSQKLLEMADVSFIKLSSCLVLMEHFTDLKQLQDTINCSKKFTELLKANARAKDEVGDHEAQPFSESCLVHRRKQRDLFCQQCAEEICRDCIADHFNHCCTESFTVIHEEIRRVGDAAADVTELLGEMKQEISRVKEMKQSVKNNYDKNITVTKEVFATLRKAIDEQEEQILMDIKMESSKREKCLQVSLLYHNM